MHVGSIQRVFVGLLLIFSIHSEEYLESKKEVLKGLLQLLTNKNKKNLAGHTFQEF